MATLLYAIGRFSARRHYLVIVVWIVLLAGGAVASKAVGDHFEASVSIPGTQSQNANDMLAERFPALNDASTKVVFVAPAGTTIADDAAAVTAVSAQLAKIPGVSVSDPFSSKVLYAVQVSQDQRTAYIGLTYDKASTALTDADASAVAAIADTLQSHNLTVAYSGYPLPAATGGISAPEGIGFLLAFVILTITFGSLLAAGMPLLTAVIGVSISGSLITLLASVLPLSSTAPVLASMLGLAVGIDYALFIASRHRTQLATGMKVIDSIALATATAGSAVVFAALTVIIALLGLYVVNIPFLSAMGLGAAIAVIVAMALSLTLLPAVLGLCGKTLIPRANSRAALRGALVAEAGSKPTLGSRWVTLVTRRPWIAVGAVIVGLGLVAAPALTGGLKFTMPDAGSNPAASTSRQAYDMLTAGFGPGNNGPLLVTADLSGAKSTDPAGMAVAFTTAFAGISDISYASAPSVNPAGNTAYLVIIPSSAPDSDATTTLVTSVRDRAAAFQAANGYTYEVTGTTAVNIDVSQKLAAALLPFGLVVVGLCLLLLLLVFRSLAVPLTAALGFLLSLAASLGVVVLVFQNGVFASILGVEKVGPVISFLPILVMAVLFGLAMDYQVFLVSRIREEFTNTGDARASVKTGFVGAARVVTAAALIMFCVFASFVPGQGPALQPIALALAVGVFFDAFLVRMTLVPAVLMLLGDKAWYLPRWLDRILPNVDIEGEKVHRMLADRAARAALDSPAEPAEPAAPEADDPQAAPVGAAL
ncbi:MMPL family transporter [Subtercola sp. RTI3]|nr:MMPL family transporter [Subtercola sp. RTI3]